MTLSVKISRTGRPVIALSDMGFAGDIERPYEAAHRIYRHIAKMRRAKNFRRTKIYIGFRIGPHCWRDAVRVGRYQVSIGCQSFLFAEIDALAKQQGWTK